jgi:hypothetical protein
METKKAPSPSCQVSAHELNGPCRVLIPNPIGQKYLSFIRVLFPPGAMTSLIQPCFDNCLTKRSAEGKNSFVCAISFFREPFRS